MATRPPLVEGTHVVVVTAYYPPQVTGSSVIMHNLLSRFDPSSFTVATASSPHVHAIERTADSEVVDIVSSVRVSYRLNEWYREAQMPLARRRLERLIRRKKAGLVVGVYPDLHFVASALKAARNAGIPFVAYLHDTIAEGMERKPLEEKAKRVQEDVFGQSAAILVMSDGMVDLYRQKYGLASVPIVHTYPEPIPVEVPGDPLLRQGFWGGSLYMVNIAGVGRVSSALGQLGVPFEVATNRSLSNLHEIGLVGTHVRASFYSRRADYLAALRKQGLLVQALNWPDESGTHEDEMKTVFPTKTPEYLASGSPMLVHCPDHYFLAQFVRKHACGVVVSDPSGEALAEAITRLLDHQGDTPAMRERALDTARRFSADRVAVEFAAALQSTLSA